MSKRTGNILVVDDNPSVLKSLNLYLKHKFNSVVTVKDPNQILHILESNDIDVILLDMNFSAGIHTGNEGLYWLRRILDQDKDSIVILITAYGDVELAVQAIKEGATDFIMKPWDNEKLLTTLQTGITLRKSKTKVRDLQQKQTLLKSDIARQFDQMLGKTRCMQELFTTIHKVADTDANVLITGENGTGKELVAREIHRQSKRSGEVFVTIDLSTLNENLFESELFGHLKGAFTDAKETRIGKMQTASEGSLFLDEIGNLSVTLQSKLLTVLQNREITPVGSNKNIAIDVRLISATNKDLDQLIRSGLFREDLLYRIKTIHIHIPPLRERKEDISLISEYFLKQFSEKYEKSFLKFNADAMDMLMGYSWPGNVRELKHTIEKAVILSEKNLVKPDDLQLKDKRTELLEPGETRTMEEYEREIIRLVLTRHRGNISYTANELNIGRQTLYRKMKKYDL